MGASEPIEIVIRPIRGAEPINLREVWAHRGLLYSLVLKELRLRFDAMHLGFLWPVVRPLLIATVVTMFKNATSADTGQTLPYFLFTYAGVVFWFHFADSVQEIAGGLQRDADLLMKVYYPRIISPLVSACSGLVELSIEMVPLMAMMVYFGVYPGWAVILFPLVLLQLVLFSLGCGLILSYLNVHVRDFERVVGLILYVGIFVSPVFHDVRILPAGLAWIGRINPMDGTLTALRASLAGGSAFPWSDWGVACAITAGTLWAGIALFRRLQHRLVEML